MTQNRSPVSHSAWDCPLTTCHFRLCFLKILGHSSEMTAVTCWRFQGRSQTPLVPEFCYSVTEAVWRNAVCVWRGSGYGCASSRVIFPPTWEICHFYTVAEQIDVRRMLYNLCSWSHVIFIVGSHLRHEKVFFSLGDLWGGMGFAYPQSSVLCLHSQGPSSPLPPMYSWGHWDCQWFSDLPKAAEQQPKLGLQDLATSTFVWMVRILPEKWYSWFSPLQKQWRRLMVYYPLGHHCILSILHFSCHG